MNPVAKALLLLEASCLTLALLALLLRGHWRTFPLLSIMLAGLAARVGWLSTVKTKAEWDAFSGMTTDAIAFLLVMATGEAVWHLRKSVYGDPPLFLVVAQTIAFGGFAVAIRHVTHIVFPQTFPELGNLMSAAWCATVAVVAIRDYAYVRDIEPAVYWHSRVLMAFLVLSTVGNVFTVARWHAVKVKGVWVPVEQMVYGVPTMAAGLAWMMVFRRKATL